MTGKYYFEDRDFEQAYFLTYVCDDGQRQVLAKGTKGGSVYWTNPEAEIPEQVMDEFTELVEQDPVNLPLAGTLQRILQIQRELEDLKANVREKLGTGYSRYALLRAFGHSDFTSFDIVDGEVYEDPETGGKRLSVAGYRNHDFVEVHPGLYTSSEGVMCVRLYGSGKYVMYPVDRPQDAYDEENEQ